MATVTTPAGDVLEGVTGQLLAYYRGDGYEITDEEPEADESVPDALPVDETPVVAAVEVPKPGKAQAAPADVPPGPLDSH